MESVKEQPPSSKKKLLLADYLLTQKTVQRLEKLNLEDEDFNDEDDRCSVVGFKAGSSEFDLSYNL